MDQTSDKEQSLCVTLDDVLFRSPDGMFSVVSATPEGAEQRVIIVGDLRDLGPGEAVRVRGRFEQHKVHGRRFRASSFTPVTPTTTAGIARYLGAGLIEGVGPALAARIVARFGASTLDVIQTQSARLREVSGIGPARAQAIAEAVKARSAEAEQMTFLHGLGAGPATARRIRQRYGEDAARVVRDDPYLVAEEVAGIGFRTADAMASALGYGAGDPRRAAGAVLHLLGRAADDGHSFLTTAELANQTHELSVPQERFEQALRDLSLRKLVVCDGDCVYAPPLYEAEVSVAGALRTLARPRPRPASADAALTAALAPWLAQAQGDAVRATAEEGLLVITGGPGTGKTTTVRAVAELQRALERRLLLAAPTGRAAKRLAEATGQDAQTLHRLLEWNPATGSFGRGRHSPLQADVVLVDEASMLDVQLAHRLLQALPAGAALVLVGDADQLPPVGPGPVLRELIDSNACKVVRLREVFRQAQESAIVRGAHEILAGRVPTPTPTGERGSGDLFFVRASDPEIITRKLVDTLARMREVYGLDGKRDVQVVTPTRRGPLGTEALNRALQEALNPGRSGGGRLREGDKIMQLRNDYEREVWNGDLGEVTRVDAGVVFATVGGREVSYAPDEQDAVALAYACTVHKVQGSEFPAVVVVLHGAHHVLLTRPLLYTAVTRARRLVVILGDERAVARAVANTRSRRTNTRLAARLQLP